MFICLFVNISNSNERIKGLYYIVIHKDLLGKSSVTFEDTGKTVMNRPNKVVL